jgi:hypothetical protein
MHGGRQRVHRQEGHPRLLAAGPSDRQRVVLGLGCAVSLLLHCETSRLKGEARPTDIHGDSWLLVGFSHGFKADHTF